MDQKVYGRMPADESPSGKYARDSGEFADPLKESGHAELHENGGDEEINVAGLSGELADDQPPKTHTVASHSDTTATGAELETLTDGSNADSLHIHATSVDGGFANSVYLGSQNVDGEGA